MTQRVLKYKFITLAKNTLSIPVLALPIYFAIQQSCPTLYCLVDTEDDPSPRSFLLVTTGQDVPDNVEHVLSTVHDGHVWHLFEVIE